MHRWRLEVTDKFTKQINISFTNYFLAKCWKCYFSLLAVSYTHFHTFSFNTPLSLIHPYSLSPLHIFNHTQTYANTSQMISNSLFRNPCLFTHILSLNHSCFQSHTLTQTYTKTYVKYSHMLNNNLYVFW